MINDDYVAPKCQPGNLDSFWIRNNILKALREAMPSFSGIFLDVGCGYQPYRQMLMSRDSRIESYIGLDLHDNCYGVPDLTWDGRSIPLADASIDTAMATEVLEHCPDPEGVISEIFRVLKPNGTFFFTVPFVWPLHEVPHDYFRYTPYGLESLLKRAGFSNVEVSPLGGWDATLAQVLGLWTLRRPMPTWVRKILSYLLWPVYYALLRVDKKPREFDFDTIFPGISGIARKPE